MAASSAQRHLSKPAPLLGIGQVLQLLTPTFPELTPSKLRFLEERGLLRPARTRSGYRKFSSADIERLRSILELQRDHYLPLNVIKQYLSDRDAGLNPPIPGSSLASTASIFAGGKRFTRNDLLREAGCSPTLLAEAFASAILVAAETYSHDAVVVLKALVELQRSGIEPRHLRGFRAAAERELSLIENALLPSARKNNVSSRAYVADRAAEIAAQLEVVRSSLTRSALERLLP